MNSPEHTPRPVSSFFELVEQLPEGDGLVLSQDRVHLFHKGKIAHEVPVHYEGLNYLSEVYRPLSPDKVVTDDFEAAVAQTLREQGETPQRTYPFMTIVNHSTNESITETINVAKLVDQDMLPIYSRTTSEGREALSVGINTLAKIMAQKVGVNPIGAVVIENGRAQAVEDIVPTTWTRPSTRIDEDLAGDTWDTDSHNATALDALQLDTALAFHISRHKVRTGTEDGRAEVVFRMASPPDLQELLFTVIDLVELHGKHLYFERKKLLNNEEGPVFTILDKNFELYSNLSDGRMLDMAIYNAYLAAPDILKKV
jgi:hypothetical protein